MEVSCAPCPPGPTSLPLSPSAPPGATTINTITTTTTTTTIASSKQGNRRLSEVSPDSGNGEDLDEFDTLKSPVKVSATECVSGKDAPEAAVASHSREEGESRPLSVGEGNLERKASPCPPSCDAQGEGKKEDKSCNVEKSDKEDAEMTACMTEKPEVFRFDFQPDQTGGDQSAWPSGKQPDVSNGGTCSRPMRGTYYSPAFTLRPLHSSLLVSCSQPFQCGPFSSPCGAVGMPARGTDETGLFSLPEGGDDMLDGSVFSKSYLLGDNGKTCIKPFSLVSRNDLEKSFRKHTSNCCDTSYSLGASKSAKTVRNPEYPRCLRARPARRYTNPEVVRKQPTSGGLLAESCDLMSSPPGQCACVNPGTSHACAPRLSGRSSMGMMNPMFESEYSSKQETHTAVPSPPRRFSLDHESSAKRSGTSDICRSHPTNACLSSLDQEPSKPSPSLSKNPQEPLRRASESSSGTSSQGHPPLSSTSSEDLDSKEVGSKKKTSLPPNLESLGSGQQAKSKKMTSKCDVFAPEGVLRSLDGMSPMAPGAGSSKTHGRQATVTSPDWMSILSPPQEAYTQRLFTPENLHEELFYPAPYGLKSEIYQNINAREADFVLQKPNRKPRTEPLPPSCLPATTTQRSESPDLDDGIIPPLATEDEEALKEGARESRKASLKERRKSSLEKIFIPKVGESKDPILNVKIDNFDREEYVKYKKTLSETDLLIAERLKFASKGKQNSQDSDSSNNTENRVGPSSQDSSSDMKKDEDNSKDISCINNAANKNQEKKELAKNIKSGADTSKNFRKENFFQKEATKGKLMKDKPTLPRQRSLEENETDIKANTYRRDRKQSLPTEELFGIKRTQARKLSLTQMVSHPVQLGVSLGGGLFSPVTEADETQTTLAVVVKKNTDLLFPFGNEQRGRSNSEVASRRKSSETLLPRRRVSQENEDIFLGPAARSLPSDASFSPYKGKKGKQLPKTKEKLSDSPRHHHHHHHYHQGSREGAHHHRHRTEHLRRHAGKSSSSPVDDRRNKQKPTAHRSPRKVPRELRRPVESHTNLGATLSPPEQETGGDLFTNRKSSLQDNLTAEERPAVPYEPLVDARTPTTPDESPAAAGATR